MPLLLKTLVAGMKDVVAGFELLVPEAVYLPAPPLYCAQPARDPEVKVTT